jgi:menaquinone-dependent protoporphyrinogen IX oxidase
VVNARKKKVRDIAEYELLIVGSGMQIDRWISDAEDILKKFQKELAKKNASKGKLHA